MPGISIRSESEVRKLISSFKTSYKEDWDEWLVTPKENWPEVFPKLLKKWQAVRPNKIRGSSHEMLHEAPYIEDLLSESEVHLVKLVKFDMSQESSFSEISIQAIKALWDIFLKLPYTDNAKNGKASVVGISKAVLLLTQGRVGPAFDSYVRKQFGVDEPLNADEWINCLKLVQKDISVFENQNGILFGELMPQSSRHIHNGRIYDMILGPRAN